MFDVRLLFVALVWGINFSAIKFALADFSPLGFTAIRFALAALFLLIVMRIRRESFVIAKRDRLRLVLLGFIGITLYNVLFMFGLQRTTAANSAMLISLSPLFAALVLAAQGRENISLRIGIGLLLASAGVFFIVTGHQGVLRANRENLAGDILTLCATASWAVYSLEAKPLLSRYSPLAVTAYSMLAGSVLLIPVSMSSLSAQSWQSVSILSWSALFFASLIAAGVAYVLWYQGIQRMGVARTMAYHYVMPIAAVAFAAAFLRESLTLPQIAGGASILLGVYLVQK